MHNRYLRYFFENEYHTYLSLPFRPRPVGLAPLPAGDASQLCMVCRSRIERHPAHGFGHTRGGRHRLRVPSADRRVPLLRHPKEQKQTSLFPPDCRYNYLCRNLLHRMGALLHGQCEPHRHLPADCPALLGVHSFRRRPEESAGNPLRHSVCRVPSGVCGGEFRVGNGISGRFCLLKNGISDKFYFVLPCGGRSLAFCGEKKILFSEFLPGGRRCTHYRLAEGK